MEYSIVFDPDLHLPLVVMVNNFALLIYKHTETQNTLIIDSAIVCGNWPRAAREMSLCYPLRTGIRIKMAT